MRIELSRIVVHRNAARQVLFRIGQLIVDPGTHLLIHGASGVGKTTLLHLLAGLFRPQEGEVSVGDYRLSAMSDAERSRFRRRHVGLVFQKLNLLDHLTAGENVRLGASRDAEPEAARRALAEVGMEDAWAQRSATLSLGEQQRVAVARVLAARPDLILADEPTSSLDQHHAEAVMQALSDAAQGRTMVVVSHDQRIHQRFTAVSPFAELVAP